MLPDTFRRWHLYGAGLESLRLDTVPMPEPGPDEVLVRHDACGICYSDIKIINLGPNHPRIAGRDMENDPVVMGHEVVLTIEKVGANRVGQFRPGQRFVVQADVYYQGVNIAYGYALHGGMAQWGIVGKEVLDGDEGCYLLPIPDHVGIVQAALVEPWACVEAAYRWHENGPVSARLSGRVDAEAVAAACASLPRDGVVVVEDAESDGPVPVDVGRVHYDGWRFVSGRAHGRTEMKGGGRAWLLGAGGPMGQMHVQRSLSLPEPPAHLVVTDRNDHRLEALAERFGALAKSRGVEMHLINIRKTEFDPKAFAPDGYDDIVVLVPDIAAIEQGWPLLGENGVLNVFAGVARGTMAQLDIADVARKNVRVVGTSGSAIADMRAVLEKSASGELDTQASLAAIGGLGAFRDGLEAVKGSRFPGKTVIFLHVDDLPLVPLTELGSVRPQVAEALRPGALWSRAAEDLLLEEAGR